MIITKIIFSGFKLLVAKIVLYWLRTLQLKFNKSLFYSPISHSLSVPLDLAILDIKKIAFAELNIKYLLLSLLCYNYIFILTAGCLGGWHCWEYKWFKINN